MKMATGFLYTSAIQAWSTIFNFVGIMWAVYAIEWQINLRLVQPDRFFVITFPL